MTTRISLLLALLVSLFAAGEASAASWKGVVVAKDGSRGTVVTASADGTVHTIRASAAGKLRLGQRLRVRANKRADGTFDAVAVTKDGRARTARVKVVVVRNQHAQRRLLVSAAGSTFALRRGDARLRAGDRIAAAVTISPTSVQATSVQTLGRLGVLEVQGILTKLAADSIELVVAKAGFVTLGVPAGLTLPAGISVFDKVEVLVAVGVDGKLTLLAIQDDDVRRDDRGVDFDEDEDEVEVEVKGTITALSATSISVTPGRAASPVTCALGKPLTGFKLGDFVELKCEAGAGGTLTLTRIQLEDDDEDEDEDDDDDDHSGPGHGGDDDD